MTVFHLIFKIFLFNFYLFIYFSWRLITLQYCSGFCRTLIWGGRWEGGSEWGTHVNPWLIHIKVFHFIL